MLRFVACCLSETTFDLGCFFSSYTKGNVYLTRLDQDEQSLFSPHHRCCHPGDAHSFSISSLYPHLLRLTLFLATECGTDCSDSVGWLGANVSRLLRRNLCRFSLVSLFWLVFWITKVVAQGPSTIYAGNIC